MGAEEFEGVAYGGAGYACFGGDGVPCDAHCHAVVVGVAKEDPEHGEDVAFAVGAAA